MKYKIILGLIFSALLLVGCNNSQEARKPISHTSGTFMKKSIERNKKLVANEEDEIQNIIKRNPGKHYISSENGYWYSYEKRNLYDTIPPKKGDVAFYDYEIKDIYGKVIYSQAELRPQIYYVDKQDILIGIREGIKIMHRGEKVNFLFPSHKAYGYHGDNKKIGTNVPLLVTVTLNNYKSEILYKAEKSKQQANNEALIKNSLDKTAPGAVVPKKTVVAPTTTGASVVKPVTTAKTILPKKPNTVAKPTPAKPASPAIPAESTPKATTNQPKDTL